MRLLGRAKRLLEERKPWIDCILRCLRRGGQREHETARAFALKRSDSAGNRPSAIVAGELADRSLISCSVAQVVSKIPFKLWCRSAGRARRGASASRGGGLLLAENEEAA